jgi:hypothetical protein
MLAVVGTVLILAALAASSAIPFLAGALAPAAATPANGLIAFSHDGDVDVVEPTHRDPPEVDPRLAALTGGAPNPRGRNGQRPIDTRMSSVSAA